MIPRTSEAETVKYRAFDMKRGHVLAEMAELYLLLTQREQREDAEVVQKLRRLEVVSPDHLELTGEVYDLQQSDETRYDVWEQIGVVHRLPDLVFEVPAASEAFSGFIESYIFLLTQGDTQLAIQARVPCNGYDVSIPLADQRFDLPMIEILLQDETIALGTWGELMRMREDFLEKLKIWLADQINSVIDKSG